ncbi:flavodoxin [Hahella ganghwensis]|uniref:flavodoxin n=1 Tax=Hahella ganghwensis TaxID=286420 RepID=UPI0003A747E6|nr:flavodoxin [Hahella ganghwensis]
MIESANVGLIYGTDTSNTEEVGERICEEFAKHGIHVQMVNVTEASSAVIEQFDLIIMGIPTWDFGGIQQDWEEFEPELLVTNLQGKTAALYGLGDQFGYGDYFLDAMGWLYERLLKTKAWMIGYWPTEGYDFSASLATIQQGSLFCGLAIDEDQQFDLTDKRIHSWVNQIIGEFKQACAA